MTDQKDDLTMIKATYIDHMGSDLSVVNAARVSFGKSSDWNYLGCPDPQGMPPELVYEYRELSDRDTKLIHYLAKHQHLSPFGHAFASFHVKAPIFVARQLVKHKFLRWNEISRRYVDEPPEFYVPEVWRGRSSDKKQGSDGVVDLRKKGGLLERHGGTLDDVLAWHKEDVSSVYSQLVEAGVAPEQARMILPQSAMTEWIWSGSLDAFAAMCNLRCKDDTQYETRIVANQISEEMAKLFPVSWSALTDG